MTVTSLPSADPVRALIAAVDALAAQAPADLAGPEALERARVVLAQGDRLRALGVQALADVDTRELFALEGAPTTSAWVAGQDVTGVDRREVALARRLKTVPAVEAELRAGRLSLAVGAKVAAAVAKARFFLDRPDGQIDGQPGDAVLYGVAVDGVCQLLAEQTGGAPADDPEQARLRAELEAIVEADLSQRARLEATLVLFAQRCRADLLTSGLALLLDALLPAEHDKRAARAEDEAGFDLHRKSGGSGWKAHGDLDDETGEMLYTVIEANRAVDPDNPCDTDAYRAASGIADLDGLAPQHWPAALARPRSLRAQRHAALKAGLRTLLDSGALGTREKAVPHIAVIVGLDFVQGVPGALPGRTMSGARWCRTQTRRILCRGAFTRMVMDLRRRVVEVSHTQRTLTALERQILHVQWGGVCAGEACARGPATGDRLIPHHPELFSNTGTTSVWNTVPLCKQDHHYVHDDRRVIKLKNGRWIGPDGWADEKSA